MNRPSRRAGDRCRTARRREIEASPWRHPVRFLFCLAITVVAALTLEVGAAETGQPGGAEVSLSTGTETGISDLHNSVLYRLFTTNRAAGLDDEANHAVTLAALEEGRAKFLFLSIGMPEFTLAEGPDQTTLEDILLFLEAFRKCYEGPQAKLKFADNEGSLREVLENDQIGFVLALEGSHLLSGDVDAVDKLHTAGVRRIGIAHWFQNEFFVDPENPEPATREPRLLTEESVLSEKGHALLNRIIEKEIIIDVSHLGQAAFREVAHINANRTPLVASHSNAKALCDLPRNLDDDQIRAIARSGGLIGVCLHSPMLVTGEQEATVEDVANHIDYLVKLAGVNHVAIGTDFEGGIRPPAGLSSFRDLGKIREELRRRGYSDADRQAILWKNAVRIVSGLPEAN